MSKAKELSVSFNLTGKDLFVEHIGKLVNPDFTEYDDLYLCYFTDIDTLSLSNDRDEFVSLQNFKNLKHFFEIREIIGIVDTDAYNSVRFDMKKGYVTLLNQKHSSSGFVFYVKEEAFETILETVFRVNKDL